MTDLSSDDIALARPIVDEEAAMDVEALLLERSSVLVIIGEHTNSIKPYQPVGNKIEKNLVCACENFLTRQTSIFTKCLNLPLQCYIE